MSKRRRQLKPMPDVIKVVHGSVITFYKQALIEYKNALWFMQINPALLLPAHRKLRIKNVYINGKKRGKVWWCSGFPSYLKSHIYVDTLTGKIRSWLILKTGLLAPKQRLGYVSLRVDSYRYTVVKHGENDERVRHVVYWPSEDIVVGYLIFSKDYKQLELRENIAGGRVALIIAAGYVVEHELFEMSFRGLVHDIKIC